MSDNYVKPNSAYYLLNSYRLYRLLEQTYNEYDKFKSLCDKLSEQRSISVESVLKMFINNLAHCADVSTRSDYDNTFKEDKSYIPPTEEVVAICVGVVLKEFMQKQNGRYRSLFTTQEQRALSSLKLKKNKPSLVCYNFGLSKELKRVLGDYNESQ